MNSLPFSSIEEIGYHALSSSFCVGERPDAMPSELCHQSAQRVDSIVAQRTRELEQTVARLRGRLFELETQANRDYLTGLASRRLLSDRFQCAVDRSKRSGAPFALLLVDLDGFKRINDSHGHAAGDVVLIEVAQRLTSALRTTDTAARLGGDEFVLIIESLTEPSVVASICDKVSQSITTGIELESGQSVCVGASVGIAMYPLDGSKLEELLFAADRAMYTEKKTRHAKTTQDGDVVLFGDPAQ